MANEENAMRKQKLWIPIILLVTISGMALTACGRHYHDPEDRADWVAHKISKKLDLTDEQKLKLEDVKNEFMLYHKEQRANRVAMIDKLIAEVKKPAVDQTVLLAMVNDYTSRVEQMAPNVIAKLALFHQSLTEKQKQELVEKLEDWKKHHQKEES